MAKKRVAPSQSNTLLSFFGAGSDSNSKLSKNNRKSTPLAAKQVKQGLTRDDAIVIDEFASSPVKETRKQETAIVDIPDDDPKSSIFGEPILLQSPKNENKSAVSINSESSRESSGTPSEELENLVKLEDGGWALGDDEVVEDNDDGYLDDEGAMVQDEVKTSPVTCEKACPLCGISIEGMSGSEIDRHVNSCIDSATSSVAVTPKKEVMNTTIPRAPSKGQRAGPGPKSTDVFSVLMHGHKENEAWKEAAVAEDKTFRPTKANGGRRKAPFYKVMPGMPIAVDAFRYGKIPGVTAYFLSHAHSDHYTNLSSSWKNGPIYCSTTTANLIVYMLNVDRKWLHPLPNDTPTEIPNTGGVTVTLIEANHCPGSSLFVFEGRQTVNAGDSTFSSPFVGSKRIFRYLHCGDFRACPQHVLHPALNGKKVDQVYLDTTYLNPKYCFPPQPLVIDACAELARRIVSGETIVPQGSDLSPGRTRSIDGWVTQQPKVEQSDVPLTSHPPGKPEKVLVVLGTYSIGKERIVKAVAKALNSKVYCDPRKTQLLKCQDDPELHSMLSDDPYASTVHVVPLQVINSDRFADYVDRWGHFTRAVGFRPTGWTYTPPAGLDTMPSVAHVIARDQKRAFTYANLKEMRNSTPRLMLYGVPYSEHSSFFELSCFALSLDWGKMIATVNVGSATSREKMAKWFEKWDAERKKLATVKNGEMVVAFRRRDYW